MGETVTKGATIWARMAGIVSLVFVAIALFASVAAWKSSGVIPWRNVLTSVGVGLLGAAVISGHRRATLYGVLVAASLILLLLSLISQLV